VCRIWRRLKVEKSRNAKLSRKSIFRPRRPFRPMRL
jgi:hypothetical protein